MKLLEKQVADLQKRVESLERHQGYLRQSYAELIREHNKRVCKDYTPQEPRLKDHAKMELLRKWADKNCITEVNVNISTYDSAILSFSWGMLAIDFIDDKEDLIDGATYTIAELCGEEE